MERPLICCGFGHRVMLMDIEKPLQAVLERLVEERGVRVFYTGGMGEFDELFARTVRSMKREYENHLLASPQTGIAKIKLANNWEYDLINDESHRPDFVCWLRNPPRAAWSLCLPYEMNGEKKSFYPDFLIVRSDPMVDYVVDILEPHGQQYTDNLPKAKALAEYAKKEDRLGRIQLIRRTTGAGGSRFIRLDLTDIIVQDKVLRVNNDDDLNSIFTLYGIIG